MDTITIPNTCTCSTHSLPDLPHSLEYSILNWFQTHSLEALHAERISEIKSQRILYSDWQETDYSDKIDNYILTYMPVNFYKLWVPLSILFSTHHLKTDLKILELGAGPGTSTISFLYFIIQLAKENPNRIFNLDYHIVEREPKFVTACKFFLELFLSTQTINNVHGKFSIYQQDIHTFVTQSGIAHNYDLIQESNVLNRNETTHLENLNHLVVSLSHLLRENGAMIMVEPGNKANTELLHNLYHLLTKELLHCEVTPIVTNIRTDQLSLLSSIEKIGLRARTTAHWFSYAIFRKSRSA